MTTMLLNTDDDKFEDTKAKARSAGATDSSCLKR